MDKLFYQNQLYPLQDRILKEVNRLETGFYLAGGTVASRAYLHHRFSDDLDFFVNDSDQFELWADRILQALMQRKDSKLQINLKEKRFVRCNLFQSGIVLKMEFINDVPARIGEIRQHPVLGKIDSPENIFANKISAALDRKEPKDLADIWGFACKLKLSISQAIQDSQSKAAGIFPADIARLLCETTPQDWEVVKWEDGPTAKQFILELRKLAEALLHPE